MDGLGFEEGELGLVFNDDFGVLDLRMSGSEDVDWGNEEVTWMTDDEMSELTAEGRATWLIPVISWVGDTVGCVGFVVIVRWWLLLILSVVYVHILWSFFSS